MLRWRRVFLSILFVAWLAAAGLVIGFCLGGLLGPRLFGSQGGHGLGDLAYLFGGAIFGSVVGLAFGIGYAARSTPQQQARVAAWTGLAGVLVAGATAVLVNVFHAW